MTSPATTNELHPFGLPMGTVRGILSVLICMFFWIYLLIPDPQPGEPALAKAPLGHFFLLTLVFLAFASHPLEGVRTSTLPWIMRLIFVGGSLVVVALVGWQHPDRLATRLTPDPADVAQWPVLLGCLAGGFGVALFIRFFFGRTSKVFVTVRAWLGVLAGLLLSFEIFFQFVIVPQLSDKPSIDAMKVWEGILIAIVAAYFGSRA